jgi:hypothetical protein
MLQACRECLTVATWQLVGPTRCQGLLARDWCLNEHFITTLVAGQDVNYYISLQTRASTHVTNVVQGGSVDVAVVVDVLDVFSKDVGLDLHCPGSARDSKQATLIVISTTQCTNLARSSETKQLGVLGALLAQV